MSSMIDNARSDIIKFAERKRAKKIYTLNILGGLDWRPEAVKIGGLDFVASVFEVPPAELSLIHI